MAVRRSCPGSAVCDRVQACVTYWRAWGEAIGARSGAWKGAWKGARGSVLQSGHERSPWRWEISSQRSMHLARARGGKGWAGARVRAMARARVRAR